MENAKGKEVAESPTTSEIEMAPGSPIFTEKKWECISGRIAIEIAACPFDKARMPYIKKLIREKRSNRGMSADSVRSMIMLPPTVIITNFFEPAVVSIGPCHKHLKNIINMEVMKSDILDGHGHGTSENIKDYLIEYCIILIDQYHQKIQNVLKWYENEIKLEDDKIIAMMLLDCIFLIMLIYGDSRKAHLSSPSKTVDWTPIMFMEGPVFTDTLLVKNQIPFFLIRKLWLPALLLLGVDIREICSDYCYKYTDDEHTTYVQNHFNDTLNDTRLVQQSNQIIDNVGSQAEGARHLLDFYYRCKVPFQPFQDDKQPDYKLTKEHYSLFPSATQLYELGIKFKANQRFSNMFHISFKKGVLQIPILVLDSERKYIFSNLLSWERSTPSSRTEAYVFSYVLFMDSLLKTGKDVALLQKFGILDNKLSSDNDAATYFHTLAETWGIIFGNNWTKNLYAPMMRAIMKYSGSPPRRHCTSLKHNYCSSPWKVISVLAGVLLLSLTIIQTILTILSYCYRRN